MKPPAQRFVVLDCFATCKRCGKAWAWRSEPVPAGYRLGSHGPIDTRCGICSHALVGVGTVVQVLHGSAIEPFVNVA